MKISIVCPTYNERDNLARLLERLSALPIDSEIVIVDDHSPDGTGDLADALAEQYGNVKVLHRPGKYGLGSAIAEGFAIASGDLLCVTDSDMSHEIEKIPAMASLIEGGRANLVVGSRYIPGGAIKNWKFTRKLFSKGAILLSRPLTSVKDSVSGFFILRREILDGVFLTAKGYKIGLEIIVKAHHENRIIEFPYTFIDRSAGASKLNVDEFIDYLGLLMHLARFRVRVWWKNLSVILTGLTAKGLSKSKI